MGVAVTQTWDTLDRIRTTLDISKERWLDLFCMSEQELVKLRFHRRDPDEDALHRVADDLDLTIDHIRTGNIDFQHLAAVHSGHVTHLPERYSVAAFSKKRTSIHLLDRIEMKFGWRYRNALLRKFQLNESVFADADTTINLRFLMDLCEQIHADGCSEQVLYEMGQYSVVANYHSPVAGQMRAFRSVTELYEGAFPELAMRYFDQNFEYHILKLDHQGCVFETIPNRDVMEAFGMDSLGNRQVCYAKSGTAASFPGYLNLSYGRLSHTSCIHRGDSRCIYQIDYSDSVQSRRDFNVGIGFPAENYGVFPE